jgi:hypothetical protein
MMSSGESEPILEQSTTSPTTLNIHKDTEGSEQEISPLKIKMSSLPARSNFSSFFCKTKRPSSPPSTIEPFKSDEQPTSSKEAINQQPHPSPLNSVTPEDSNSEQEKSSTGNSSLSKEESNFMPKVEQSETSMKSEHSSQIISSSSEAEFITISDDDEEVSDEKSNHRVECISISSNESSDECSIIAPRRSKRLNLVVTPEKLIARKPLEMSQPEKQSILPLSDYSNNMKNANFFKPPPLQPHSQSQKQNHQSLNESYTVRSIEEASSNSHEPSLSLDSSYDNFDPSLRDELLARINSKKQKQDILNSETRYVLFNVIQRLNIITGAQSPSFKIYWKSTESFGNMKRRLAMDLGVSPFDLVLAKVQDNSELYDTTRPNSLNIIGLTLQEFSQQQPTNLKVSANKTKGRVNTKKNDVNSQNNDANDANRSPSAPSSPTSYNIYLYTRKSFSHYNLLQQNMKQQFMDSVSLLQTADAEMSKFSQTAPANEEEFTTDIPTAPSQQQSELISLKIKTLHTKNQVFTVSVPSDATGTDILEAFAAIHSCKTNNLRIFFDGDALDLVKSIEGILEDDDMIEIK